MFSEYLFIFINIYWHHICETFCPFELLCNFILILGTLYKLVISLHFLNFLFIVLYFRCRIPTHFVLVFDTTPVDTTALTQARGSIHSIRRGSTDVRSVGSDYLRRTSLAKLNSLPLEAPITKVRKENYKKSLKWIN